MGYYHTAQICTNGHLITDSIDTSRNRTQKFCDKCGNETITNCTNCNSPIRGDYDVPGVISFSETEVPNYCYNCGKPYPWTTSSLEVLKELLALESSISTEELTYYNENLPSLIVDTPKSNLVATKLKLFINKSSKVVASSIKDIIVEIASETAKKIIFNE